MNHLNLSSSGRILTWLVLLLVGLVIIPPGKAAPPPPGEVDLATIELPPEAQLAPAVFTAADKGSTRPPKLDSTLVELATTGQVSTASVNEPGEFRPVTLVDNRVQVEISPTAAGVAPVTRLVEEAGGRVTGVGFNQTLVQAWLPLEALESLSNRPEVAMIRRPPQAHPAQTLTVGDSVTEALPVINAETWHQAGLSGAGVKVGIIDLGFLGYTDLLGTDLPEPDRVTVRNFVDSLPEDDVDDFTRHGTAVAEIIHDIAPASELYLAEIWTLVDLDEAVQWLIEHDVDIISTSLGFLNVSPGDSTGPLADLVRQAHEAGILWVTAAGNERETHWGGLYTDPEGNNIHNFAGTQEVNYFGPGDGRAFIIPPDYLFAVYVRWNDWEDVHQDYDLYLTRWSGSGWGVVGLSDNFQTGQAGQTPTEFAFAFTSDEPTAYGFFLSRYDSDQAVNFEIFTLASPSAEIATPDEHLFARSLSNLADSREAVTVAALDIGFPFTTGELYPQESYSSEGPPNGPGGSATGAEFNKPDLAAFANVSTESYGGHFFNGTSAATPHVAGAAALILGANPAFTPTDIRAELARRAIDIGPPGVDTQFGHGRLFLGDPPITAASTLVHFTPSGPRISTGDSELINLAVEDAANLQALDFRLTFDQNIIQITDADPDLPGTQIEVAPLLSEREYTVTRNQVEGGVIEFAAALPDSAEPINGSGALAAMIWQGITAGLSDLTLTEVNLKDREGNALAVNTENGLIEIVSSADAQIEGQILLQGRTDHSGTNIFLSKEPCITAIPDTALTITDSDGNFEFTPSADHSYQCLQAIQAGYLVGQHDLPAGNLGSLTLSAGDVTGDNLVDIFDLAFIATRYHSDDLTADVNANGYVDIFDLALTANNYKQQGPVAKWEDDDIVATAVSE